MSQPRRGRPQPKVRRGSRSMGMDYLPPAQRTPPKPWHVATAPAKEPAMPLEPAEVQLRQVLHAAGERQQFIDPNDVVKLLLDPDNRGRLTFDAAGQVTNADALAAELADTSPHLVAGMGTRLRRAGHVEAVPPLQLPDDDGQPTFQGSADGGAKGTGERRDDGEDMNSILRRAARRGA